MCLSKANFSLSLHNSKIQTSWRVQRTEGSHPSQLQRWDCNPDELRQNGWQSRGPLWLPLLLTLSLWLRDISLCLISVYFFHHSPGLGRKRVACNFWHCHTVVWSCQQRWYLDVSWQVWGHQIMSFFLFLLQRAQKTSMYYIAYYLRNFRIWKKAALHEKSPVSAVTRLVLSDLHIFSLVINCLTAHDAETKLVNYFLNLVEKSKDHPLQRSDNLSGGERSSDSHLPF